MLRARRLTPDSKLSTAADAFLSGTHAEKSHRNGKIGPALALVLALILHAGAILVLATWRWNPPPNPIDAPLISLEEVAAELPTREPVLEPPPLEEPPPAVEEPPPSKIEEPPPPPDETPPPVERDAEPPPPQQIDIPPQPPATEAIVILPKPEPPKRVEKPKVVPKPKPRIQPPKLVEPRPTAEAPPRAAAPVADPNARATYAARVHAIVASHKRYPGGESAQGSAVVTFTVVRSGALTGASLSRSSGNPALDQAALATVRASNPLPPFPAGMPQVSATFSVPISFSVR